MAADGRLFICMEFGLFTMGYMYATLETAFADAAAAGYDYIELWGGRPHAYALDILSGGADVVLSLGEKYNMPVRVYTPEHNAYPFNYMLGGEGQRQAGVEYLCGAMDAARKLGAAYMLISAGNGGASTQRERRERLLRSLRELTEHAEKVGQNLLLEPLTPFESNTLTTLGELAEVLERIDSPRLFGMCDTVPAFLQGEDVADYVRVLGGRMRHLHLVDSDGKSEDHLLPGDGIMPLCRMIADIRAAGYDGTATIELVTKYMHDQSRFAKLAMERIRTVI